MSEFAFVSPDFGITRNGRTWGTAAYIAYLERRVRRLHGRLSWARAGWDYCAKEIPLAYRRGRMAGVRAERRRKA